MGPIWTWHAAQRVQKQKGRRRIRQDDEHESNGLLFTQRTPIAGFASVWER